MVAKAASTFSILLMLTLISFWGSSFVVVKLILAEGLTPIAVATFRFTIAGILFIIALLVTKLKRRDFRLLVEGKDLSAIALLALSGVTLFFTAQYTGIKMAGASIAAIVVCLLSPIFITVSFARMFNERLSGRQLHGIVAAAIGTLIVIMSQGIDIYTNGGSFFLGSLLLLSTPILWTIYTLAGRKTMEKYDAFLVVAYVNALGGLFLIPFSLAEFSLSQALTMSPNAWMAIFYLSATCSFIGYYIWFHVIKREGAAFTSSFLFAEPLITAVCASVFINEKLGFAEVIGGCLIFTGVFLVTRKQS